MKRNTIVAQLGKTASRWQYNFLKQFGFKVFHEPSGGWEGCRFEEEYTWNRYLTTRMACRPSNEDDPVVAEKYDGMDLRDVIINKDYIEVGFASLPFISNVSLEWKLLGVVRHPQTWIYSAIRSEFYKHHISWKPETFQDYATIWNEYNNKVLELAERTYRMEDFNSNFVMFAQEFGYYGEIKESKPLSKFMSDVRMKDLQDEIAERDDGSWWPIVEELADKFNYTYESNYIPSEHKESTAIHHVPASEISL